MTRDKLKLAQFTNFISLGCLFPAPPVAPTNVSGHAINSTSISVSWDINLERGFKLRRFIVSYRAKFHNDTWEQNKTVRVNSSKNTTIITGLRVFTEYEIKVAAATNFSGPYSQPIIKTTKEGGEVYFIYRKYVLALYTTEGDKQDIYIMIVTSSIPIAILSQHL